MNIKIVFEISLRKERVGMIKKTMKLLSLIIVLTMFTSCNQQNTNQEAAGAENAVTKEITSQAVVVETTAVEDTTVSIESGDSMETVKPEIILSTTTSTRDSGLLDYILGDFTAKTGIEVKVIAVGTGKALQMGRDGEADVLLVHAKASEEEFVAEGYGTQRYDVMYNDFVLVGPKDDNGLFVGKNVTDIVAGFKTIYEKDLKFVSRGDDSGTNKKELSFWEIAKINPTEKEFYISAGKGMGDVLIMADEMNAYTLTDRATYLSMRDNLESLIVIENDSLLFNQYGVIPVNPDLNDMINSEGAQAFVDWILSDEVQQMIGEYGVEQFDMPLFIPNATN